MWMLRSEGLLDDRQRALVERLIYHVPGGAYYDRTKISAAKGERWFCSEEEALAAGWRRAKQ